MSKMARRKRLRVALTRENFENLPAEEHLFDWAVGKFMIQFQQVELHICSWLALQMNIDAEDMVILIKDSNFNQKMSLFDKIFMRVDGRKNQRNALINQLRSLNEFRNMVAHGLFLNVESALYLSMPSKDFLELEKKAPVDVAVVIEKIKGCRNFMAYLVMHRMSQMTRPKEPVEE